MEYAKRTFIKEAKTELHVIGTSLTALPLMEDNYVDVEVLFNDPTQSRDAGISLDLSFSNEKEKEETLKSLNVIINDVTELKSQLLNHKFTDNVKNKSEGEN